MKKLLLILSPILVAGPNITNLTSANHHHINTKNINTKSIIQPEYSGYINAENTLISLLNQNPQLDNFANIVDMLDASIWNINVQTDPNFLQELNSKINYRTKTLINEFGIILPTDRNYLNQYVSYAYHYVPLYTMLPYMYNQILKQKK